MSNEIQNFQQEQSDWRKRREARLLKPMGWLEVIGLDWLKIGPNFAGSDSSCGIQLPDGSSQFLFRVDLKESPSSIIEFLSDQKALMNGEAVKQGQKYELHFDGDGSGQGTVVNCQSLTMVFIKRDYGHGVRTYDSNSQAKAEFTGLDWFPADPKFKIKAKWIPLEGTKKLMIPDVLGQMKEKTAVGCAVFQVDGFEQKLFATMDDGLLFFIFKDLTHKNETYGTGRFLYATPAKEGAVTLDFNRAISPPCAFTPYATCPLPPAENVLKIAIPAGEKKPKS